MEKKKCLTFLFCLILCYSLFQHTARAQSSSQASIFSQGSITYPPSNVNLAVIPDDWERYVTEGRLANGPDPQIVFLDTSVTHNGHVSIRCDGPATSTNQWRELDAYNASSGSYNIIQVKPGDHVVFKMWMKTNPSTLSNPTHGARFGFDLYGSSGRIWECSWGFPATTNFDYTNGNDYNWSAYKYVSYGTSTWTQGIIDGYIPTKFFTENDGYSGGTKVIPAQQVSGIIPWVGVDPSYPSSQAGSAWFADAELYINPT